MDDSLRVLQYLYGEEIDDSDFPRRLSEDDELRREYEQFRETKATLDRRPSRRPDPEVVDDIVDAAAEAAQTDSSPSSADRQAPDRTARAPRHTWRRRLQGISAVLVLVLVVGLGWWALPGSSSSPGQEVQEGAPSTASSAMTGEARPMTGETSAVEEAVPEWDDRDELVRLHRRIEYVETRSRSNTWEEGLQPVDQTNP